MNKKGVLGIIKEICEPLVEELKYELVDIEFVKEGPSYFLRVYLDKPGGINLDDCQKMSQLLSDILDEKDPIKVAYYLEVSSPGLDRPLKTDKDLKRNIGKDIEVKLYEALDGKKLIEGTLDNYNESSIILKTETNTIIEIPRELVAVIKLSVKF
ncbi:ribosome maturation factor RimP [Tissierella pigra]|uniref:Ribosome maturation factor RimP n=1 Tax=Tissierella pigra TaxID=2607614 RepID=A0A6N7XU17_9FIRM|nr:ribosome maturation factor RimP [Tissierella pigra]MBU5426570.1 ribosome maturation factor RimP [Tissierella pigra]MST99984.1 ribosome maturation factor RimP [Tissierella pigra]